MGGSGFGISVLSASWYQRTSCQAPNLYPTPRLVEITEDILAMNVAASGIKPYGVVSNGLDILTMLEQEIVEFTDDGPACPDFR